MLGYVSWAIDPTIVTIGSFNFGYYTICWGIAFLSCYLLLRRIFREEGIDNTLLWSLLIYVFVGSFIGARLGHCLFYDASYYLANPLEILLPIAKNSLGEWTFVGYRGLASHGGAIGIVIALALFAWRKKISFWWVMDKLGLVAPLGGAFIRLGNLFNSEIIGKATTVRWAFIFERVDHTPRHPAQLYEALAYLAIFVLLYYLYKRRRADFGDGFIFGLSITLIFLARFTIEFCKEVQESFEVGLHSVVGMNMGQILSIPFIIMGIMVALWSLKKRV